MKIEAKNLTPVQSASPRKAPVKAVGEDTFAGALSQAFESIGKLDGGMDQVLVSDEKPDGEAMAVVDQLISSIPIQAIVKVSISDLPSKVAVEVDKAALGHTEAVAANEVGAGSVVYEVAPMAFQEAMLNGVNNKLQPLQNITQGGKSLGDLATPPDALKSELDISGPIEMRSSPSGNSPNSPFSVAAALQQKINSSDNSPENNAYTLKDSKELSQRANLHVSPMTAVRFPGESEPSIGDNGKLTSSSSALEYRSIIERMPEFVVASGKENMLTAGSVSAFEPTVPPGVVGEAAILNTAESSQLNQIIQTAEGAGPLRVFANVTNDDIMLRRAGTAGDPIMAQGALPFSSMAASHSERLTPGFLRTLRAEIISFVTQPDRSSITLEITPPEYGKVLINASQEQGLSVIRLVAETHAAKIALLEHMPKPTASLEVRVYTAEEYRELLDDRGSGAESEGERRQKEPKRQSRDIEFRI